MAEEKDVLMEDIETRTNVKLGYNGEVTCCDRLRFMLKPIQSFTTTYNEGDGQTNIVIIPEAFRMWFYFGFLSLTALAYIVGNKWGGVDVNDNPILNNFGSNNMCIYYDNAPFSLFSTTLYVPIAFSALLYVFLDYYRVYDSYIDKEISKGFWIFYSSFTFYEVIAFILSIQFTATTPYESLYIHTIPYVMLCYAFFTVAFKKFLYMYQCGIFHDGSYHKCWYYLAWVYMILLGLTIGLKSLYIMPNLFGARSWEQPGWEWTPDAYKYIRISFIINCLLLPMFIYFIFTKDLKTITITINRTKENYQAINDETDDEIETV